MATIELTEAESEARDFFKFLVKESFGTPCDVSDGSSLKMQLPCWYDEAKYKRGQQYFRDNRLGILVTNLVALIGLLADSKGLDILISTNRSNTKETARKRYVSTIMHTLAWYEIDLTPGSKSWESLSRVRKMHLLASNNAVSKQLGHISQSDLVVTAFGFMGLVITRPHLLGIRYDNLDDREAFVHLWAVVCHMIGIQDRFNFCLKRFEVVEIICQMFQRYFFVPLLQVETPKFKEMITVLLEGLSKFLMHMSYDIQLFTARRIVGVPGYQFLVDKKKEKFCRSILSREDLEEFREIAMKFDGYGHLKNMFVDDRIPLIEVKRNQIDSHVGQGKNEFINIDNNQNIVLTSHESFFEGIREYLELKPCDDLSVKLVDYERDWQNCLNDSKFYKLSKKDQIIIRFRLALLPVYENRFGRFILDTLLSIQLFIMQRFNSRK